MKKNILFALVATMVVPQLSFAAEPISASTISNDTTEAGGTATFTISLNEPIISSDLEEGYVTIALSSSDADEGSVAPSEITFAQDEWSTTKTVTVTGVHDDVDDGDVAFSIILSAAESNSEYYSNFNPADVSVINLDDDTASVFVETTVDDTTEYGGTGEIEIVLTSQPTAHVMIPITASDDTELFAALEEVVFTANNWNIPQNVPIIALDDDMDDGNIQSAIVIGPAESEDTTYNGLEGESQLFGNVDNDTANITVSEITEAVSEDGADATVMIQLHTQPQNDVTVNVTPNDQTTVNAESFVFTAENWNTPQLLTLAAADDAIAEDQHTGSVSFVIESDDSAFAALTIDPVDFSISDNDVAITIEGMYLRVTLNGNVLDEAKVGKKTLNPDYYQLKHEKLYQSGNYTTIALLKMNKHRTARLVVFRLTADNQLTKKRVVDFTTPARTPFELMLQSLRKRIRVEVGSNDTARVYRWRVLPNGDVRELE